jgi:signal transduction histidine kinase/DNA-binding response OmpR family regulator
MVNQERFYKPLLFKVVCACLIFIISMITAKASVLQHSFRISEIAHVEIIQSSTVSVTNDTQQSDTLFVFGYHRDFIKLSVENKGESIHPVYILFSPFREFILYPVVVAAGESTTLQVKETAPSSLLYLTRNHELITEVLPEIEQEKMAHYIEIAFCGMVLIMVIYMLGKCIQVRTKDYLFYTLHLGITFLFLLAVLHESNLSAWYSNASKGQYLHHILQTLSHICYFQFVRYFIHTKSNQPKFDTALSTVSFISLGYAALEVLQMMLPDIFTYSSSAAWIGMRVLFLLFGLACLVLWVAQSRHPLRNYLLIGTASMLAGGIMGMLFYFYPGYIQTLVHPFNQQIFYFRAGIVVEILFFSLGLGFKQKLEEATMLRMEARLQQEHDSLVNLMELDQFKSRFFANISHEFRTPLTLILGSLQSIRNKTKGVVEQELWSIQKNSNTVLQLVNQLLDLSRIEAGKMDLQVSPVHVSSFLRALAQAFISMAEQKKIELSIQVTDDERYGYVDATFVEKIVNNLLSNAIKYNCEYGKVTFCAEFKWPMLVINVKDTGIGIKPEHKDKIFERFFRIDQNGTQGTGLGLSVVKELVKIHKGEIKVESVPNQGSQFTISLPVDKGFYTSTELNEKAVIVSDAWVTTDTSQRYDHVFIPLAAEDAPMVLVVEDNDELRHFIKESLHRTYKIIEAKNGEEGIKNAIHYVPDLIVSDWMMPGTTGIDLCLTLKSHEVTNHIPIMLLTAKAGQDARLEGLETGADDYLTKPFDLQELSVRVKNLIAQRKVMREKFMHPGTLGYQTVRVESVEDKFLKRLQEVIEDSLGNAHFSIDDLAEDLGMSRIQLYRKCNALTQKSPKELLQHYRLERAADLLRQRAGNVSEVAYQVGYENLSHFAKSFRKHFGRLPSEMQK